MYSWKSAYLRSGLVFGVVVLGLSTCNHPTGLLQIGEPYTLRTINGRALPYSVNGAADGPAVTQGSVTFLAGAQAQRWERMGRRGASPGDSVIWEWMQPGSYYNQLGRVVVRYSNWQPGQNGPRAAADTLEATESGGFILRQAGGLVLRFCPGNEDC